MSNMMARTGVVLVLSLWQQMAWCDATESAASQFRSFLNDIGTSAGKAVGQNVSNAINGAAGNGAPQSSPAQADGSQIPPSQQAPAPNQKGGSAQPAHGKKSGAQLLPSVTGAQAS